MRKIFLAFGLVGLGALSASFAACSSSSGDDSSAATDSGTDTSVAADTGTPDTGTTADAGKCATCGELLAQGLAAGSPCAASVAPLSAALSCVCNTNPLTSLPGTGLCDVGPDGGADAGDGGNGSNPACSDLCANAASGAVPTAACQTCAADNCSTELAACQADTGS